MQILYVISSHSKQIFIWKMNNKGILKILQVIDMKEECRTMVIHPNKKNIYVGTQPKFKIFNFKIEKLGTLKKVNESNIPGNPTYLSINKFGNALYSVSYSKNCLSVSSIDKYGNICSPVQIFKNLYGCHSANVNPNGTELWVPCLKINEIKIYKIEEKSGYLFPYSSIQIARKNMNVGPRHMTFSKSGKYAYVINELSSTLNVISTNNCCINKMHIIQTTKIINKPIICNWSSDIHITPNGDFLYCCDRNANIISTFKIENYERSLQFIRFQETEKQPREFNIDKSGKYLIVAGQKSNHISVYRINNKTGNLQLINRHKVGINPVWILFYKN